MTEIVHEKTPDQHSSIVGGSSASRVIGCPGSVRRLAKLPPEVLNRSSSYADEGTGLHEVMAYLVENDIECKHEVIFHDEKVSELFDRFELKHDRFFDAVMPAYKAFNAYLDRICEEDESEDFIVRVESRVAMPGIEGAFGTADILICTAKRTVVWDWKFGAGKPVYASYTKTFVVDLNAAKWMDDGVPLPPQLEEETEEFGNDQLMFYGRAALETHPEYFGGGDDWPVDLVICQPRIGEGEPSIYQTNVDELESFRLDLIDAVDEALGPDGKIAKGDYCYFAACKSICPLHLNGPEAAATIAEKLGKLKDQSLTADDVARAEVEIIPPGQSVPVRMELDAGQMYAMLLELKEMLDPMLDHAAGDAHAFMEAGGRVPGWKLVPKRAGRDTWGVEREKVDGFLARQGMSLDDRREPWEPISPAKARTALKGLGKDMKEGSKDRNLLEKYVQKGVSSGTTIAPESDSRPAVQVTASVIGALADKIAAIGGS